MAISYVGGVTNSATGSASTKLTFDLTALTGGSDSSPSTGDIVVVNLGIASVSTRDKTMAIETTGYTTNTLYDTFVSANQSTNMLVCWKIMGAIPDGTVTTMASGHIDDGIAVAVHVWRGVDQTTPIDVATTTATGTGTGQPTPAAITPTTAGSVIIVTGAGATPNSGNFTTATLSNFITNYTVEVHDIAVGVGSYAWSSGEYTPATFGGGSTNSFGSWAAATLVLRPAGPANLKTYNTNLKANIKTINTNVIANVKTLDTNA